VPSHTISASVYQASQEPRQVKSFNPLVLLHCDNQPACPSVGRLAITNPSVCPSICRLVVTNQLALLFVDWLPDETPCCFLDLLACAFDLKPGSSKSTCLGGMMAGIGGPPPAKNRPSLVRHIGCVRWPSPSAVLATMLCFIRHFACCMSADQKRVTCWSQTFTILRVLLAKCQTMLAKCQVVLCTVYFPVNDLVIRPISFFGVMLQTSFRRKRTKKTLSSRQ
jgi:hypothetical protein